MNESRHRPVPARNAGGGATDSRQGALAAGARAGPDGPPGGSSAEADGARRLGRGGNGLPGSPAQAGGGAPLPALVRATDRLTGALGRFVSWFVLAMALIGAYNALVRYLGRFTGTSLSSNLYLELQWYLFSLVFLLGAGYALKENAHVRVDVLYGRLGKRARAWIDTAGAAFMLLPFCVFLLWVSWPSVHNSWTIREVSPDPGGLPRYPLKAVILVCFALLAVQGVAQLAKDGRTLLTKEREDEGDGAGGL